MTGALSFANPGLVGSLAIGFDFGRCLYVPASPSNAATIPSAAATNFGAGDFTMAAWVYLPATLADGSYTLLYKVVNFDQFLRIHLEVSTESTTGTRRVRAVWTGRNNGGATAYSVFGQTYLPLAAWACFCFRRSAGTYYLHSNAATDTLTGQPVTSATVAASWLLLPGVGAYVDSLAFYNRCLSTAEAAALYNGGLGSDPLALSGCVACYRFDETPGTATASGHFADSSPNAVAGTLTGYASGSPDFVSHATLS